MNKVCARHETISYQIEFPSPVYTSAIMGEREDICVGVGGGKRFGMPNIVVAIEKASDPKLVWNVCSWLDLGDDIPWSGAKQPMAFVEEGNGTDKQFLAMSHLDSVSIIEYEKNKNYDPKLLAEELQKPPEKALGKRDSPPPPKNGPVFLRRVARFSLVTNGDDPDKKVCAILRSATQPSRLTDQLFFVCQDDSSIAMFRLKKRRKQQKPKAVETEEITDSSDGQIKKESPEKSLADQCEEENLEYEIFSYTIPSTEIRMGTAHPTDMDARETSSGIVLMIVCDDKKVRVALLPQAWHCLDICKSPEEIAEEQAEKKESEKKAAAALAEVTDDKPQVKELIHAENRRFGRRPSTLKQPLAVVVRSLLVLTPDDLGIPFAVMRSTLRVGLLLDEDSKKSNDAEQSINSKNKIASKGVGRGENEGILLLVMAYDSKNASTNAVMARISIVDNSLLALLNEPSVTPVCKGAITNLMPLYGAPHNKEDALNNFRPMPQTWLATTVEGTIVELVQQSQSESAGFKKNENNKASAPTSSSSSSQSLEPYAYPRYTTGHQRPHKLKRCPPHLAAFHQEPISSAAVSSKTGLLVTVDIAQKARLSRLELPSYMDAQEAGDSKGGEKQMSQNIPNKGDAFEKLPLVFPLKSKSSSSLSFSFASLTVIIFVAFIGVVVAVAPQFIPPEMNSMLYMFVGIQPPAIERRSRIYESLARPMEDRMHLDGAADGLAPVKDVYR